MKINGCRMSIPSRVFKTNQYSAVSLWRFIDLNQHTDPNQCATGVGYRDQPE